MGLVPAWHHKYHPAGLQLVQPALSDAMLRSTVSSLDICSIDNLTFTYSSVNETQPSCMLSVALKFCDQEGIRPTGEMCLACRSPLAKPWQTEALSLPPEVPGTTGAQRCALLNSPKYISCSQLPLAPWSAKLSWKPFNEIKRCLQMISWQYLNRCTQEMSALAHTAGVQTNQWR